MKNKAHSIHIRQKGSGLVEVLVSVLVLAIGVLGFAGLQTRAMRSTSESYMRSQAMAIAQDLAERVRINREAYSSYVSTTSDWTFTSPPTEPPVTCIDADCIAANMATFDVADIRYIASTQLPQGLVNMRKCQVATTATCIYVSWDGVQPTAGTDGQCVNANGTYNGDVSCVMLEIM